jgi:hypothetical protein
VLGELYPIHLITDIAILTACSGMLWARVLKLSEALGSREVPTALVWYGSSSGMSVSSAPVRLCVTTDHITTSTPGGASPKQFAS